MQAVHDKAFNTIISSLKKDTIEKVSKLLSITNIFDQQQQHHQEDENVKTTTTLVSLDPVLTSSVLPPAFLVAVGANPGAGKTSLVGALQESFKTLAKTEMTSSSSSSSSSSSEKEEDTKLTIKSPSDPNVSFQFCPNSTKIIISSDEIHVLPMDGYHRYRSELSAMKNPEEAFRRRGAPFTFNDEKYAANLEQLKKTGKLNAPAFAHAKKDPEEEYYKVDVRTKLELERKVVSSNENEKQTSIIYTIKAIHRPLVIVEGLYCLYDEGEFWKHAVDQFDLKFFLKIDIDVATERLTRRHMRAWGISEGEARERAAGSDRDNGLLVIERAKKMAERGECVVLESVDDVEFAKKCEKYSM